MWAWKRDAGALRLLTAEDDGNRGVRTGTLAVAGGLP